MADAPNPREAQRLDGRDWLLVAIALTPFVALAVVAILQVGHGYLGANDNGMTELRISDIGSHWPMIGPFSRDGWSHPGPALFYVLLLPYRLTGSRSNGLLVGAALINTGAVAGMILLARRWGGTALAVLVALGCLVLLRSLGVGFAWDPWNPFVTVLPFGLVLFATWAVTCGDVWCLPVVAGVGSFCAQTHVEYVPLVAVLGLVAIGGLAASRRRPVVSPPPDRSLRAPILVTIAVLVACWCLPVAQQLTGKPGNLQAILGYFRSSHATHSLREGYDIVVAQFAWRPNWLVGGAHVNPFSGAVPGSIATGAPIWVFALLAALVLAWRRGLRVAVRLGIVLGVVIATSVVAIARTVGPVFEYRLRFVWVVGMLSAVLVVWVLWSWASTRTGFPTRPVATIALVAIVVLGGYEVATAAGTPPPNQHDGRIAASLAPQLRHRLPPGPGAVVIGVKSFVAGPLITGIMLDLERHDVTVAMHDILDDRLRFGAHRMLGRQRIRAEVRVVIDDEIEKIRARPCTHELAYWGAAPRHRRDVALATLRHIERALARGEIDGHQAFRRTARISADLPAAAVFQIRSGPGC